MLLGAAVANLLSFLIYALLPLKNISDLSKLPFLVLLGLGMGLLEGIFFLDNLV